MSMFEEMNFCGNLDFFSAHPAELLVSHEVEPEATVEEDYTDDEMDVDELERRMWRDRMLLRKLKEQNKSNEGIDSAKQRQSQEQARRKKMSRAQDGILKYMLKMMEVCKAQGFVYGIIPEMVNLLVGHLTTCEHGGKRRLDLIAMALLLFPSTGQIIVSQVGVRSVMHLAQHLTITRASRYHTGIALVSADAAL
ncbi:unnamed protein product [Rhodiola kirilowii]